MVQGRRLLAAWSAASAAPLLWAATTQVGQILPYADCALGHRWTAIAAVMASALALLAAGVCWRNRSPRWFPHSYSLLSRQSARSAAARSPCCCRPLRALCSLLAIPFRSIVTWFLLLVPSTAWAPPEDASGPSIHGWSHRCWGQRPCMALVSWSCGGAPESASGSGGGRPPGKPAKVTDGMVPICAAPLAGRTAVHRAPRERELMAVAAPLLALARPIGAFWALPVPVRPWLGRAGRLRTGWSVVTAPVPARIGMAR